VNHGLIKTNPPVSGKNYYLTADYGPLTSFCWGDVSPARPSVEPDSLTANHARYAKGF